MGRFPSIDPIADQFAHVSPFNYAENEPVGSIDLWGLQRWKVNGRERNFSPSSSARKAKEFGAFLFHRKASLAVGNVKRGGTNISSNSGRFARHAEENGNFSKGIGSERNAYRHALWSAKITQDFGSDAAQNITKAHEGVGVASSASVDLTKAFEGNLDLADNIVDLLNNEIGQNIGESNEGTSMNDLATKVLDVFKNGGLWVATEGKDGSVTITRSKISKNQYNNAVKNLNNLDKNGMSAQDKKDLEEEN